MVAVNKGYVTVQSAKMNGLQTPTCKWDIYVNSMPKLRDFIKEVRNVRTRGCGGEA